MSKSYSVVIQGGGPVGLACAAWLLQKNSGLALLLVDRNPADDAGIQAGDSRGIALSHGSKIQFMHGPITARLFIKFMYLKLGNLDAPS
jgi:2-polyprenyl-6-methoxyphenol hydroxylase-like FAD-dependent oxidoreductase